MEITEKELLVINEIANNHHPDQRTIASRAGISLGLTNLIIKNLIVKGYVKAKQLTTREVQYLLTPEGFGEKAKKSYNYTLRTINIINQTRRKIKDLILEQIESGSKSIVISVNNDMTDMTELALINLTHSITLKKDDKLEDKNIIKFLDENGMEKKVINMIEFLSGEGLYHNN